MTKEHVLFVTGNLAAPALRQVLEQMSPDAFTWEVRSLGVKVAALLTGDLIRRRLSDTGQANRVILPGLCRGDLEALKDHYGVPFQRGPEELMDLPEWFGLEGKPVDLSQHSVKIFAEITDAPLLDLDSLSERAHAFREDGADVIDLGCLPDTPFPLLASAVRRLKAEGFLVSVDSIDSQDLLTGGLAGADFLLSLTEKTLWISEEVEATPILIPTQPGDLDSLIRSYEALRARGRDCILDPVLDPIHFGFTDSLVRYHELRKRLPDVAMMMGTGNLSELTEADTTGIHALLSGVMSELQIGSLLTTEVSPHCRSAVRELDLCRRVMFRAREHNRLPKKLSEGLACVHERKPFPYGVDEVREAAGQVKDANFRIKVTGNGIHIYNRDRFLTSTDPFLLFPDLDVERDGGHAFYLGVELARAEIAHQLGKRYTQDQPLRWGCTVKRPEEDLTRYTPPAPTKRRP
ncbi:MULTISPECIES: DUF6513 domain-containing protein [unclassified Thioalkalivibrio]|uniref:DUF6513 domain-containing protein n=1 Tax=unclassified Thioalkalivibrio TaxID=2621013 RepID=UPI001E3D886F|nr:MULTISPECIES: DUF6513 domain-containing protein [unclassified Thioalkalivibrio]